MTGEGTVVPINPPGADLPRLIREWREETGRTLVDLADEARLGLGQVLLAAKGANVSPAVRRKILTELFRDVLNRNAKPVDIAW